MGRRIVTDKITSDDILGTNGYHAPEVLFDDSYDFRADIFMLGLTFCVMVCMALHKYVNCNYCTNMLCAVCCLLNVLRKCTVLRVEANAWHLLKCINATGRK